MTAKFTPTELEKQDRTYLEEVSYSDGESEGVTREELDQAVDNMKKSKPPDTRSR